MSITLGQRRSLQQCALNNNTFAMLAIDQRGSLLKAMSSDGSGHVPYAEVAAFKTDILRVLSPLASAVLVDAEYGYAPTVCSGAFSGHSGMLLALEKSGYAGDPYARQTELLENWSVAQTRRAGASGVKLLIYYNPDAPNASNQEAVVQEVATECRAHDLPLFLEPIHFSLDPNVKIVPNAERRRLVIESARRLVPLGVTILKAEFPVDIGQTADQVEWADACRELSGATAVPWVLLSAGVDYETYEQQVQVASQNGASGILCGRAVWKETIGMSATERKAFVNSTSQARFRKLSTIVEQNARPFTDFYPAGAGLDQEGWYIN